MSPENGTEAMSRSEGDLLHIDRAVRDTKSVTPL